MSRLNFSPVDQAFLLGSSQIKDTQKEIDELTKLILDSNTQTKKTKKEPDSAQKQEQISPPDKQVSTFKEAPKQEENIDYNLMKVISDPKFDDIVRNYAMIHHPEWLLNETSYTGKSTFGNRYQTTVCSEVRRYIVFFVFCVVIFLLLSVTLR